jgi:3,4-dihydroxy 2-butanone 4-phosphate synthase/GTP cyclohydrolase II
MKTPDPARVEVAVDAIRRGRMVVVIDDPDRENEGDLVMAARFATPEAINFMARYGRGLICVPMTPERLRALHLEQMVETPQDTMRTAFTVSVDARTGVTTGISAADRAETIKVLIDPDATPEDLVRPGHVFPLEAKPGGVLRRPGHTEAAVDLARLAGLEPAGVICEILRDDGTMMRTPELFAFADAHGLPALFIADLVQYRLERERLIERGDSAELPTPYGVFQAVTYREPLQGLTHLALVMGPVADGQPTLVRVHAECLTGDALFSTRCACGANLEAALRKIGEVGRGVLLYMRQDGRGPGLAAHIAAYARQDRGQKADEAHPPTDRRDFGVGAQILADLGLKDLVLMTNHPKPYQALEGYGLRIIGEVPLERWPAAAEQKAFGSRR